MPAYTPEQFRAATNADLYDFLIRNHFDSFKKEGVWLRARFNSSLNIRQGFYGFIDFARNDSGNGIKFLSQYMHYSEAEAVIALSKGRPSSSYRSYCNMNETTVRVPPSFPIPCDGYPSILMAYLNKSRKISAETINAMLRKNIVYQFNFKNNTNIMFNNPQYDWGEIHGTNTYAEQRCKRRDKCINYKPTPDDKYGRCICSSCENYKRDSFHGVIGNARRDGFWYIKKDEEIPSEHLYICEAAIDAISLYELHRLSGRKENAVYISVGGVDKKEAIIRAIKHHPHPVLAVDNDDAGKACRGRYPEVESIVPQGTDWNEDLVRLKT